MADFKTMFPDMDDEVIEVNKPILTFYVIFESLKYIWSVVTFRNIYL
jgi:hypothetical protein